MWSEVEIGSNRIRNTRVILRVGGRDMVSLVRGTRDDQLLLTAEVYDHTGIHVGRLRRNAWLINADDRFELTTAPKDLALRDKESGELLLHARVVDKDRISIPDAIFYTPKGSKIVVTPEGITFPGNNRLIGNTFESIGGAAINFDEVSPGS